MFDSRKRLDQVAGERSFELNERYTVSLPPPPVWSSSPEQRFGEVLFRRICSHVNEIGRRHKEIVYSGIVEPTAGSPSCKDEDIEIQRRAALL